MRYYSLNFFAMLEEDLVRTLLLIFHLPVEGALYTEIIGGEFPNETLKLLIQLVHNSDILLWSKTKDAERKRNYPKPPVPEYLRANTVGTSVDSAYDRVKEIRNSGISLEDALFSK